MKRKAQGALEYLFMIAAALIIVLVVVRYLKGSTSKAKPNQTISSIGNALSNITSS
ncbi:MAG: class III signal peptide-containing protein [Thermococci archaeon]|nr:class III signal peptide-containing protein [Thermococci archaeon]